MENKMLKMDDIANRINVSRLTVYRMCTRREIPHYKFKGSLRFDPKEINSFLKSKYKPIKCQQE